MKWHRARVWWRNWLPWIRMNNTTSINAILFYMKKDVVHFLILALFLPEMGWITWASYLEYSSNTHTKGNSWKNKFITRLKVVVVIYLRPVHQKPTNRKEPRKRDRAQSDLQQKIVFGCWFINKTVQMYQMKSLEMQSQKSQPFFLGPILFNSTSSCSDVSQFGEHSTRLW